MVSLRGDFKEALSRYPAVRARLRSADLAVTCTGKVPFMDDFDRVLEHDLVRAELVSLPLALLVLLLVFRTVVAAALPGRGGRAGRRRRDRRGARRSRTSWTSPSTRSTSARSSGSASPSTTRSSSLSRYREELAAGHGYPEALARALERAGRVVCFSGLAVGTGLCGAPVLPGLVPLAMGVGGAVVVALAIVFALTFLPALLAVLGPRIHAWALPISRFGPSEGFWHRAASWVMRRPVAVLVPTLALLARDGVALPPARDDGGGRARPRPRRRGAPGLRDPAARLPGVRRQPRRRGRPLPDRARAHPRAHRRPLRPLAAHRGDSPRHQGREHRERRGDGQGGLPGRPPRPSRALQGRRSTPGRR